MIFEHKFNKMVEFSHTDMAGIVHFSNFYRFMEAVEHDMFRSFGKSIAGEVDENGISVGWPRVQAECSFYAPLKFEDEIELHLIIREIRSATIKYEVIFSKEVDSNTIEAARGTVTIVHVGVDPETGKMSSRPIPEWLHEKIKVAPENYLVKKNKK